MTIPSNQVPATIDYTSRDFYSLKEDMIARIKNNIESSGAGVTWTGEDPSDFGVALVEAFAYMGDVLNYYIDRVANEVYLPTATQRQSIINIAQTYGYNPSGYRNATCDVVFFNSSESDVVVPAGTQVSGEVVYNDTVQEVIFTVESPVTVPASSGGIPGETSAIPVVQGEYVSTRVGNDPVYGELVGVSNGTPGQRFMLSENQVVDASIEVYVEAGDSETYEKWTKVNHIIDYNSTDSVYTTYLDSENFVYIQFGDGVSGVIPTMGSSIKVQYLVGGGQVGNISSDIIDTIRLVPAGFDLSSLEVSNPSPAVGGADPESNQSIRVNAPKTLSTLNRAVTLSDFANLALSIPNVGKANSVAESRTSVTVYVSPQQSSISTDVYPGYTADPNSGGVVTTDWVRMQEEVKSLLETSSLIGTTVTVTPPTYVPALLFLRFTKLPQYTDEQVRANILTELVNSMSYNYMRFEDVITPEEIESKVRQVDGVYNATVVTLHREGGSGRNILLGEPGEIFTFLEENIDILASSSSAELTNLTVSAGTLSPVFAGSSLNYNLPLPNGTASVDVTPTNSTAKISINGNSVASGSAATITTAVGTTVITIAVTAQDGITTKVYRITATRTS